MNIHAWASPSPHRDMRWRTTPSIAGDPVRCTTLPSRHHQGRKSTDCHVELKGIVATIVSAPREYPEYTPPGYYAVFFKDPEGIEYEIVCAHESGECGR